MMAVAAVVYQHEIVGGKYLWYRYRLQELGGAYIVNFDASHRVY